MNRKLQPDLWSRHHGTSAAAPDSVSTGKGVGLALLWGNNLDPTPRKQTALSKSRGAALALGLLHFDLLLTLVWPLVKSESGELLWLAKTRLED